MIEVHDLKFSYSSGANAVKGVSFSIAEGQIFGFLGPSGAGKSTTQKILIRLLQGYEGRVSILDKDLNTWDADYYQHIGVSFELPNHYQKLTALENLNFFRTLYNGPTEDPYKLLEMVGLENDANTRVAQFSKGMQMRLNFVRALLHRPRILFLDEPTSGLDPVNARNVKDIVLQKRREGCTIFLTTHDMHVADELCDQVAFIVDGTIVQTDSPRELKIRHGERLVRVEYGRNGHSQQREFALEGLGSNNEFLSLLRAEPIQTIHTKEATLDDIFIKVTGRALQ